MQIFGQNPRTDVDAIFKDPHLSDVHLHCAHLCDALHYLPTMDCYQRCMDSIIFFLHPIQHLASAIMSQSPRILNLHLSKKLSDVDSIRTRVRVSTFYLMVTSHSQVTTTALHCMVSDFMATYREGRSLTKQMT